MTTSFAPESYQEYLAELGQKLNALERLTDKATGIDDRLDVLVRLGIEQLKLAKSSVMAQPLLGAGLPAYNIRRFELDDARTAPGQEVQVPGNTVIAYSDGTLEGCYIRLEDATSEPIPLNEFNASYYSRGFSKFWIETDSQSGKYLRLLILRGLPGSVITEMAVNIAAQTLENLDVDIVAQSLENLNIDIAAQTIGDITISIDAATIMAPVDIQGAYIMMPVDIQAQYVNVDVDIVAQTVGNIAIDINAQTIGDLTIDIEAQSVGVYLQPEWAALQGEDKTFTGITLSATFGISASVSYEVPTGKKLFISSLSVSNHPKVTGDYDHFIYSEGRVVAIATPVLYIGGLGGCGIALPRPLVVEAGQTVYFYGINWSGVTTTARVSVNAYEIDV